MINYSTIEQLKSDVGNELAVELLKTFINESKKTIDILINTQNLCEIEISAHSLKSSAYSFGASGLGDTCTSIESIVKIEHSAEELNSLLKIADEQSAETFKQLESIIQNI
jgi:HPt (histidine-containing phosphotransfer) domain-containing protein